MTNKQVFLAAMMITAVEVPTYVEVLRDVRTTIFCGEKREYFSYAAVQLQSGVRALMYGIYEGGGSI